MKKIVIDGRMGQFGRVGIAEYFNNLVRALSDHHPAAELHIIQAADAPDAPIIERINCTPHRIAPTYSQYGKREWWEQVSLPAFLDHLGADIYHSPNYYLPFSRSTRAALAVTLYDASLFATPKYYKFVHKTEGKFLIRHSAKKADAIIFGSKHAQSEFRHYLGSEIADKGRPIYIGLPEEVGRLSSGGGMADVESVKRKFGLQGRYIVTVGSVHPRKNYERLIEAMAHPEMQAFELLICGAIAWKAEGVFEMIRKHGLEARVKISGFVETADMVALIKGAEVMAFPSLYEGFGIPPLEAFALDVPVCASDVSSIPEVVGVAAVLFDPYSVEGIASALAKVANDPGLKMDLVAKGKARLATFSWEKCAKEHMEVYEQAIMRRRRRV